MKAIYLSVFSILSALMCWHSPLHALKLNLSKQETRAIGLAVWHNESACSHEKLTWWNEGEEFPSLGIGHFIWHPKGNKSPFGQTFPSLLVFLKKRGQDIPAWLSATARHCPWTNRTDFLAQANSTRMQELRALLAKTVELQTEFIIQRIVRVLPTLLKHSPEDMHEHIKKQFHYVTASPKGIYALIDYVHFKGEGCKTSEAYNGHGWGLLQVLTTMKATKKGHDALEAFVEAAQTVLKNRVANAVPERNEQRWLPGWTNRVQRYLKPII